MERKTLHKTSLYIVCPITIPLCMKVFPHVAYFIFTFKIKIYHFCIHNSIMKVTTHETYFIPEVISCSPKQSAQSFRQTGHTKRYNAIQGLKHSINSNQHKTEQYNKNSLNLHY